MLAVFDVLLAVGLAVTGAILLRTRKAKEKLDEELEQRTARGETGLREARRFAEDIILDTNTAHPSLAVSPDRKHVHTLSTMQDIPDKPVRFTVMPFVLGHKSFSSGSHYWEVEVAGQDRWQIGLCWDSVKRKVLHMYTFPENGFWSLSLSDGRYEGLTVPRFVIDVETPPDVVGVFLQYEKGLISFYNVNTSTILYTFKSKFTQPLRPYFYPGPPTQKSTPGLTILPVPSDSDSPYSSHSSEVEVAMWI
uniref:E3 ubiquitin-protein ligase TRIM39-like n=1 Tax=Ictidomys tridecemlineatus TaxID=43179 RepID=UPI001A9EB72A|nr:E3 ubiquitin-protein ligase TRIM39-like [Ictidomys tridecemlineatus]